MSLKDTEIADRLVGVYDSKQDAQILNLVRVAGGWETDVYAFTLEHGPPDKRERGELILRLYPGDGSPDKAAREFNAMRRLYQAGYPVPQVLHLDQDGTLFGLPFVIMVKIEGRPLGAIVEESSVEVRQKLLTQFCRMFVDLHALDWRPFASDPWPDSALSLPKVIGDQLSGWQQILADLDMVEFDLVFDWLWERLPAITFTHPSVIHGDYHGRNVLLQDDGAAYVIDWPNVAVSDYRTDLAWTLVLSSTYGQPDMRELILGEYERIAGRPVKHLEFFDVMSCLRRLGSIMVSLQVGAGKAGMRPGAEDVMKDRVHIEQVYVCLRERTGLVIKEVERLLSGLK